MTTSAAGAMFFGTGGAVGVAEDVESGMFDRLRSLPIPRSAVLIGRSLADTALVGWGLFITVAVGILTGFRFHGSALDAVVAIGLCLLYGVAFTWPFIYMGLVGGTAQAEAVLGHSAGWFAVRAIAWSIVIVAIFLPLATRRFARAS